MKKSVFLIIVIAFGLSSCQKKEKPASISGKITNSEIKFLMLKSTENEDAIADTAYIDENGSFKFEMKLSEPGFYLLRVANQLIMELFISPGDELSFDADMTKPFDQIKFKGKGEIANNYLFRHLMNDEYLLPAREVMFQTEEKEFSSLLDKALETKTKDLDSFYKENKKEIDKKFYTVYNTNLLYEHALMKLSYKQRYPYYTQQENYQFSPEFDDYLKKLDIENPENLISSSCRSFLVRYIDLMVDPEFEKDTIAQQSESGYCSMRYEKAKMTYKNPQILDYVLYQIVSEQVKYYGIKEIDNLMADFKKNCKNENFINAINQELAKWEPIASGKPAPDFKYPDMTGKIISLSEFKGKLVYIDVWATWCGPCKRESPYFHQLAKDYEGKDIVFIQVSVDDDVAEYKEYMKEIPENTYQLYAGGWKSSITKDYLISSIPRFLLIDRNGNILDNNAKRPSDKKIKEIFDNLLSLQN